MPGKAKNPDKALVPKLSAGADSIVVEPARQINPLTGSGQLVEHLGPALARPDLRHIDGLEYCPKGSREVRLGLRPRDLISVQGQARFMG
jgi:hypothetical protein